MRLLSLHLERYGPFTGRHLAFRSDARLHVVLGPNEAGKSCALAAVTDLLFGTKETRFEFLHRDTGLRLGAEILARDGRTLAFFRRRGGRNTLSDPASKPLPDDALAPFLGGLTRTVFCNAFGLDASSLREGGKEMLKSDGEIGAALFAAASGLRGFRDAANALAADAAALFTPSARKRRLNDLIKIYDDARSAARAERVGTESWRAVETGLEIAAARLSEIAERRQQIAQETNRLKRLKAVAPILAILDDLASDLHPFADLPDLDGRAVAALDGAVQASKSSAEQLVVANAALARIEAGLADMPVDEAVLPWLDTIEALAPKSGEYQKDARDLPRIQAEAGGLEGELEAVAVRLGVLGADDIERRQPSDSTRADLKVLLSSGREIEAERLRIERDLDRLRDDLATQRAARSERAPLVDPGPLRATHEALRPVLAETGRRDLLQSELAHLSVEIDRAAARLRPSLDIALDQAASTLPPAQTIKLHADTIANVARERDRVRERIDACQSEIADVTGRMRPRRGVADVPDREALMTIRQERDAAWTDLRGALLGHPAAPSGAVLLERSAVFERASLAADAMADRLVEDAQGAADQAADARRVQNLTDDLERASAQLSQADQTLGRVQEAWRALWAPLSAAPSSPAEMTEWRSRVAALLDQADKLASGRAACEILVARVESVRSPLETLADRLGLAGLKGLDVALLDERVTERLRKVAETWDAARESAIRIESTEKSIGAEEAALAACVGRRDAWGQRWRLALSGCSLTPDTSLDGAGAALDAWSEVPGLIRERNDRRRRVAGMRRDMEAHETQVRQLAHAVAVTDERPVGELLRALAQRAKSARESGAARIAQSRNRDEAARLGDDAGVDAERAETALATLRTRLGLRDVDDLPDLLSRLGERARILDKVSGSRDELARAGEGVPEAELRSGLADLHVDAVEGRLSQLASEAEQLDHDGRVAHSDRDRLGVDRARMEGGIGSEAATARKSAAEIDIRETARRYVVLKLGSLLLGAAIDRHRAGQQDPLVMRAGGLFSDLTGGAYTGLDQMFDESDQAILAGRRAAGRQPVAYGNMSEGTRDQLFLALRLAYLEDYAERAEPAPFLGDDLFASFDDRRTEYGLAALAAIGASVQPILFTHHESVARQAERCLGREADVIDLC